jgi:pyruvate,water dikinase
MRRIPRGSHRYLISLADVTRGDVKRVGGKAANLGELLRAGFAVPDGFVVIAQAFSRSAARGGDARQTATDEPNALPAGLGEALRESMARFGEAAVAVRSSAIDEDGEAASFAGQHESYLNVVGAPAVAEAVARCRASARSERAIAYRRLRGQDHEEVGVAVLVQRLIRAEISVVVFSANPVTGNRDEIVMNANWGLGESIVGGTATPDTDAVRKADLTPLSRQVGEKRTMCVPVPGGTREVAVPRFLRSKAVLADDQVVEIARLARDLELYQGRPVDVECAYHEGRLYLLQCRPITTV